MSAVRLFPGETINGRDSSFKIERALSSGSLGTIFLGHSQGGTVVVKMPKVLGDELDHARRERVMLEIDVLRKMREDYQETSRGSGRKKRSSLVEAGYQHTLHYVDDGYHQGYPFLVTEFVVGGRFKEIYSTKPATLPTALRFLETLLETVEYLHSEGIVHRDINPSNLIMEPSRDFVLIDFGVAKWKETRYSEVRAGTRLFSAPEQFEQPSRVGEASDLFAVASTSFYVLTGREPPEITSKTANVRALLTKTCRNLPPHLLAFLETAMMPDPDGRFSSAKTMLNEVQRIKQETGFYTLFIDGKSYDIFGTIDVGQMHVCNRDCSDRGFEYPLSVAIHDPERFLSRHHFRIEVKEEEVLLSDLKSTNGTAVRRKGESEFEYLGDRNRPQKEPFKLEPGDVIALAYDPKKGPYKTAEFTKRRIVASEHQ
jgi:serine/threonine protein kinase